MWEEIGGDKRGWMVFTCSGCTDLAALVKEVSCLKHMVEDMKETAVGLRFEDK